MLKPYGILTSLFTTDRFNVVIGAFSRLLVSSSQLLLLATLWYNWQHFQLNKWHYFYQPRLIPSRSKWNQIFQAKEFVCTPTKSEHKPAQKPKIVARLHCNKFLRRCCERAQKFIFLTPKKMPFYTLFSLPMHDKPTWLNKAIGYANYNAEFYHPLSQICGAEQTNTIIYTKYKVPFISFVSRN